MGRITINLYEKGPKKSLNKDIKTQDKEIEITSNGTTEITPDTGFTALNSVSVNVNVPQSGGTELDGEYYLAKPSGKYWKFTCADYHLHGGVNVPFIDIRNLTDEECQALINVFYLLQCVVYSAVCASEGIPFDGSDLITPSFIHAIIRVFEDTDSIKNRDNSYALGAFQDCSGEVEGIKFNGLINLIQVMMSMTEGIEVSEEEAILMISEMFMLEQISKEEYDSYYNWEYK
jgi:hypothetical protein